MDQFSRGTIDRGISFLSESVRCPHIEITCLSMWIGHPLVECVTVLNTRMTDASLLPLASIGNVVDRKKPASAQQRHRLYRAAPANLQPSGRDYTSAGKFPDSQPSSLSQRQQTTPTPTSHCVSCVNRRSTLSFDSLTIKRDALSDACHPQTGDSLRRTSGFFRSRFRVHTIFE